VGRVTIIPPNHPSYIQWTQKKFLKLWYKKKKITLQDMSLNKTKGPTTESKEFIVESEVESEAESTEGDEVKPQEGKNKEALGDN
jgi:hypothetical protein